MSKSEPAEEGKKVRWESPEGTTIPSTREQRVQIVPGSASAAYGDGFDSQDSLPVGKHTAQTTQQGEQAIANNDTPQPEEKKPVIDEARMQRINARVRGEIARERGHPLRAFGTTPPMGFTEKEADKRDKKKDGTPDLP